MFNKNENHYEQMPANMIKCLSDSNALYQSVTGFYDFECIENIRKY